MKDYPYFKAYVAEILIDTLGMTLEQKGSYLDNLMVAWKSLNPNMMPSWMRDDADIAVSKSRKLSENAKKRWSMQLHSKSNAKGMQKSYKRREEKIREEINTTPLPPNGGFTDFWEAYPKRVDKQGSMKSFSKAIKKTTLGTILNAIEVQKRTDQWTKDQGQFIPNPTTWLNQERWTMETPQVQDTQSWAYLEKQLQQEFGTTQPPKLIGGSNG